MCMFLLKLLKRGYVDIVLNVATIFYDIVVKKICVWQLFIILPLYSVMKLCECACMYVCMCVCAWVRMHVRVCVCVCVHVCVCVMPQ